MDYALEIKNLKKSYSNFQLQDFNLELPKGIIMGLVGENGAGKSTVLKSILNLLKRNEGTITFWGKELTDDNKAIKEDIGVVFDEMTFQELLTPEKLGKIAKQAYKRWDMNVYNNYLAQFKVNPKKKIKEFSRGMQVKLSLAVALSHQPKLLILDEATSGLDPIIRDEILDIFLDFVQDEEHSILLSTHITSDLEKIADYITFLHEGKLIFSKEKDEIIYQYGILRCKEMQFSRIEKADILAYRKQSHQIDVLVKNRKQAEAKYKDCILDTPSLDEIMLIYVKGERV